MTTTGIQPALENEQTRLLKQILEQVQISNVKLFGNSNADKETDTGRLPQLELDSKNALERLRKVEQRVVYASGVAIGLGIILSRVVDKMLR